MEKDKIIVYVDEDKKELLDELKKRALQDNTLPLKSGASNLVFVWKYGIMN